jgi:molecular chaperone GrpE
MTEKRPETKRSKAKESPKVTIAKKTWETAKKKVKLSDEYLERLTRLQADFENYRKRVAKEREGLFNFANESLITELLPVLDNFERAIKHSNDVKDISTVTKGVELIEKQLRGVLEKEGLKVIETKDETFDPEKHEAVERVASKKYSEGTIVEEMQKGYILKDRVIRPAAVKVSKRKPVTSNQ